jgi:hypothetical protein
MATSGVCNSWKAEVMSGGHCFNTTVSTTGDTNTNFLITNLASTAGIAVGMSISDGAVDIPANTVVASVDSATQITMSKAATGSTVGASLTIAGDVFKILLIKTSPATTFSATQTNVGTPGTGASSTSNVGTDEVTGTGYTSGGFTLTNVGPSLPGGPSTTATVSFSPNPSWTSATFSTTAAIIYNSSTRLGAGAAPLNNRTVAVYDFGGTQTVSSGTLTLIMPTNDGSNAILRIA